MELSAYLAIKRIQKKSFAHSLGITRQHLRRVLIKEMCSKKLAQKIVEMTDGHVKINELLPKKKK